MLINDITLGFFFNECSSKRRVDDALEIFNLLFSNNYNLNSIVFTTILKAFICCKKYKEALVFFERIKHLKPLPGMIITFNSALNIYSIMSNSKEALNLFIEIDDFFTADLVTFSTIIKTFIKTNQKHKAFKYI